MIYILLRISPQLHTITAYHTSCIVDTKFFFIVTLVGVLSLSRLKIVGRLILTSCVNEPYGIARNKKMKLKSSFVKSA